MIRSLTGVGTDGTGKGIHLVLPEQAADLVGRDGQVAAVAQPGLNQIAQAAAGAELAYQPLQVDPALAVAHQ